MHLADLYTETAGLRTRCRALGEGMNSPFPRTEPRCFVITRQHLQDWRYRKSQNDTSVARKNEALVFSLMCSFSSFCHTRKGFRELPWQPLKPAVNISSLLWGRVKAQPRLKEELVEGCTHLATSFKGVCSLLEQTYMFSSIFMGERCALWKLRFFDLYLFLSRCNSLSPLETLSHP